MRMETIKFLKYFSICFFECFHEPKKIGEGVIYLLTKSNNITFPDLNRVIQENMNVLDGKLVDPGNCMNLS